MDMSEFMEKHTVSRLIGAPPGYVGYEEGGKLTEAVRRKPYSVILFDEIEKAHPDVFNILLQILEDGRLTDSKGHTVDFKNTVIIMTSNVGQQSVVAQGPIGFMAREDREATYEKMKETVLDAMKREFRPEFLNRIDEIIVFHSLNEEHLARIVDIQLDGLRGRLRDRHIEIELQDGARAHLVRAGYEPVYGARPLKRAIQREIETPLARLVLEGKVRDGQRVEVGFDAEATRLSFTAQG
jgi:ATP-dependent Clp protease ATP-binding subunit ClpA